MDIAVWLRCTRSATFDDYFLMPEIQKFKIDDS